MTMKSFRSVGRKKRTNPNKIQINRTGQKHRAQTHTQTRKQKKDVKKGVNKSGSQHSKDNTKGQRSERHRKKEKSEDKKEEKKEDKKEEKKEDKKDEKAGPKSRVHRSEMRDREREREKEEKEQDSESDAEGERGKKGNPSQPKNVSLKPREVNDADVTKLLERLRVKKADQPVIVIPEVISEKDKILLDRVVKKKSYKYSKKNPLTLLAQEDDADFFKKPAPKKPATTTATTIENPATGSAAGGAPASVPAAAPAAPVVPVPVPEDSYDHVPKLADVLKLPEKNVYTTLAVPYWAVNLEPDDEDMKDIEPPISVGSDHIEMMQKKQIILKVPKNMKLVLDEYQPMAALAQRDESNFHTHLVFSNTVRSLVNVNIKCKTEKKKEFGEEPTQAEENISWSTEPIIQYIYDRDKPIASAREKTLVNDPSGKSPSVGSKPSNTTVASVPSTSSISGDKE